MATFTDDFSGSGNLAEQLNTQVAGGVLESTAARGRATSTDLLNATAYTNFDVTLAKKPGGVSPRFCFSPDGTDYQNGVGNSVRIGGYNFVLASAAHHIDFGSPAVVDNTFDGGGTVMFWILATSNNVTAGGNTILDKLNSGTQTGWTIRVANLASGYHEIRFFHYFSGTDLNIYCNQHIEAGKLTHVAITYNNSSTANLPTFYINGRPVSLDPTAVGYATPTGTRGSDAANSLVVGATNKGVSASGFFDGFIGDLRVFAGESLTKAQIETFVKRGVPGGTQDLWMPGHTNANDTSGNGNNGTVTGATLESTWSNLPPYGEIVGDLNILAYEDTSTSQVVNCGSASGLDNSFDGGGTWEAWIWMRRPETATHTIIAKRGNEIGGPTLFLSTCDVPGTLSHKISFLMDFDTTDGTWISDNFVVPLREWCHVAVKYDSGSVSNNPTIYVNGVALTVGSGLTESSTPVGTRLSDAAHDLLIGNNVAATTGFPGFISNVGIFLDLRSDAEVEADFDNGWLDTTDANLEAYWPLNEGTGTSAADATGHSHTGTITLASAPYGWQIHPDRPLPAVPAEVSIDISALATPGFTVRTFLTSLRGLTDRTVQVGQYGVDYTSSSNRRRRVLLGAAR